jgi:predicted nuclease of predicted toxin-antitoxin system
MKLILDENLAPALAVRLQDIFPDSVHVHACALGSCDDSQVWEYSKTNGYVIVTKDSDFHERSLLYGIPPKVIWIKTGNCSTAQIENLMRTHSVIIHNFNETQDSVLVIS